jgi:hypothetical protein
MTTAMASLDGALCDNTLAHVLSFLDFPSAVRLTQITSLSIRQRLAENPNTFRSVWRQVYERHNFSPLPSSQKKDYLKECRRRRQLFINLASRQRRGRACFNLPNRYFNFVPVTPQLDGEEDEWDEAPPVDFDCPSFLLVSPGTSGELLFLDPFDGSLLIQECCTDNAVASDEGMMEQAMTDAASLIRQREALGLGDMKEEHIAGAVIEESVYRNHNMEQYQEEPSQVLMDVDDYFQIDLSDYFVFVSSDQRRIENGNHLLSEDEEVEIDFVGVDCKPILSASSGQITGTAVVAARTFCSDSLEWSEPKICTEMMMWKRSEGGDFEQRRVCRFRSYYKVMEVDPYNDQLYVNFPFNEGPLRRFDAHIQDEETDHVDFEGGGRVVAVYPMELFPDDEDNNVEGDQVMSAGRPRFFPKPNFILKGEHPVSTLIVTPGGETVMIGTTKGTIDFWDTTTEGGASMVKRVDIKEKLKKLLSTGEDETALTSTADVVMHSEVMTAHEAEAADVAVEPVTEMHPIPVADLTDQEEEELSQAAYNPTITSFHFPGHYPIDRCGFVTLHYVHGESSWLLVWRKEGDEYNIVSTINLPLSARRKPRIHYDGRRLIVCGQDHIGMIILVYHVLNSLEDLASFVSIRQSGDGGVMRGEDQVKFVNRIRHAALGGLEFYDSVYMTANERYVIVNTKSGNLLGGGSPGSDGLLVIDLEDSR